MTHTYVYTYSVVCIYYTILILSYSYVILTIDSIRAHVVSSTHEVRSVQVGLDEVLRSATVYVCIYMCIWVYRVYGYIVYKDSSSERICIGMNIRIMYKLK